MINPTLCADGHSYEKHDIEKWLIDNDTSPTTGMTIENQLIPNHTLRKAMSELCSFSKKNLISQI